MVCLHVPATDVSQILMECGRQAPGSLVLMPSTSPLWPGTCQQWPTWEMFRGANATNQPMSIDEHGVDVVFCSCLQPAHLVIAEVSQAPMGWWKQAPCSLVLMPSTSPLGLGTCQQWQTWGRCSVELMPPNSRLVPERIKWPTCSRWCVPACAYNWCLPDLDGMVEGKHRVLWCWCL